MKKEDKIYYIREIEVKYKLAKEVRYKKKLLLKHLALRLVPESIESGPLCITELFQNTYAKSELQPSF